MPELPEVEIVKRELDEKILHQNIIEVYQSDKSLRLPMPTLSRLIGAKITSIRRRNKYIILETELYWCVIHLGMTGRLTIESTPDLKKHTHYRMKISNGSYIKYEDARRFGLIVLYDKKDYPSVNDSPLLVNLGVEPFDKSFTPKYIEEACKKRKIAIKKLIMDSNIICGIGNIYASEILFLCKLNPLEASNKLTNQDYINLHRHTIDVLQRSISLGGSSISDYVHTNGVKGEMQNFYNVYGKNGDSCKLCSTVIDRVNIGGRNSYFCPNCQAIKL